MTMTFVVLLWNGSHLRVAMWTEFINVLMSKSKKCVREGVRSILISITL